MLAKKELQAMISVMVAEDDVKLRELPEMDLYMEQLLKFLNTRIKVSKEGASAFTKTMINNYARKDGVLMQPRDKKYNHYHILSLILIHNFKNILSMEDIKLLFSSMFNDIDDPGDDLIQPEQAYAAFCRFKEVCHADLLDNLTKQLAAVEAELKGSSKENRELVENFLLVLTLTTQANIYKKLAERIIKEKFADAKI